MADTSSRVIIDVAINAADAAKQAEDLAKSIKGIKDEQAGLKKSGQETSVAYAQNSAALRTLTGEQKAYITISQNASGSNNQLRAQLSLLTTQYNALGKEERDGTTAGKAYTAQIKAISDELKKNESAVGDNRRNVGNYADALANAQSGQQTFSGGIRSVISGFGTFPTSVTAAGNAITNFVGSQRAVIQGFQTLRTLQAESLASTAAAAEADNIAAAAAAKHAATEEALAAAEAELNAIYASETATAAALAESEAALAAVTQELVVAQQELIVASSEAAAAQEAAAVKSAEASEAQVASNSLLSGSFSALGGVIVAALAAAGASIYSFLQQYDSFSDGLEQDTARFKAGFSEIGGIIKEAFGGGTVSIFNDHAFEDFFKRVGKAADDAAKHTDKLQLLQDRADINEQENQQVQNEVQLLRIKAKNRALDNDSRQAYLDKADKMEKDQQAKTVKFHADAISETIDYAVKQNESRVKGNTDIKKLTDDDIAELKKGNIDRANVLLNSDQITRTTYKSLKERYSQRNADQQQANSALEKIYNDQEKYQLQADQKAKMSAEQRKKQEALDLKAEQELAQSRLNTAALTLTARQQELAQINVDFDKKEQTYRRYNNVVVQLELEREAKLKQLAQKYSDEDTKTINDALDKSIAARIALIQNGSDKEAALRQVANEKEIGDINKQIIEREALVAKGEEDKNGVLDALYAERQAVVDRQQSDAFQKELKQDIENDNTAIKAQQDRLDEQDKAEQKSLDVAKEVAEARKVLDNAVLDSAQALTGEVVDLLGKNTTAGKIAFGIQKALAIAQIIINAEQEKSEISLAASIEARQWAKVPLFGGVIAAGIIAAAGFKIAAITAREVSSTVIIAAQTVGTLVSGKARGGIQGLDYKSDGKGAILPGYSKEDNLNAYLRSGEAVIVSEAVRDPHTRNLLSFINQKYGGRSLTEGSPSGGYSLGGTYAGGAVQQLGNDVAASLHIANLINTSMKNIQIYTSIVDIKNADANYTRTIDRATF